MEQTITHAEGAQRPTFLKVLCILSFIGTGLGLIGGIGNWWYKHQLAGGGGAFMNAIGGFTEQSEEMTDAMNEMANAMGMDFAAQATSDLIVGLLNILVFLGAFMMWNFKRTGFYVYTLGQSAQLVVPFVVVGGLMGGITATIMGIFSIAFIIMYGVNLKHLS